MSADPPRRPVVGWPPLRVLLPLAFAFMALAFAATYATSRKGGPVGARAPRPPQYPAVVLATGFPPEPGPGQRSWRWMSDTATAEVVGSGKLWIGLRASSLRRPRLLQIGHDRLAVTPRPRAYVAGPFSATLGHVSVPMSARPGGQPASKRDRRKLAIFVSSARAFPAGVAVIPGTGFYDDEPGGPSGATSWMRARGRLDVVSQTAGSVRLGLVVKALRSQSMKLLGPRGETIATTTTAPNGIARLVVANLPLRGNRASLTLVAGARPQRVSSTDPRLATLDLVWAAGAPA